MSFKGCISSIYKAVGRNITDEYDELFEDVVGLIEAHNLEGRIDDVSLAVEKFADRVEIAALVDKRNAMLNRIKKIEVDEHLKAVWGDAPEVGFEALLVGVMKGARGGSRHSVMSTQSTIFAKHSMGLVADLESQGLFKLFISGEVDLDIWRAIHALDGDGKQLDDILPEAVEMARYIQKHTESLRILANQHGASIGKVPGYLIKQTHDSTKIYRNKDAWYRIMLKDLDWERSFEDELSGKARTALLDDLYTTLASGVHLAAPDSPPTGFKGFGNIGKKMSHQRVLHFKNADAEYNYHKEFGSGKMTEGVIYGIEKMAQDIGILKRLGPNAEENLQAVQRSILRRVKAEGDPIKLKRVSDGLERVMKKFWPNVNGLARVPGNHMLADVSQMVRSVQMWSKLGGAVLSGISDVPFYASEVKFQGGTMLGGLGEALSSLADNVPKAERARLMSSLSVIHEGMLSSSTKRFDASSSNVGKAAAITNTFFKFSGLRWWTDQLRTGFAKSRSHYLALSSHLGWKDIDADLKRVLNLYGLDERKWGVLQKAVEKGDDGRMYMTPESVEGLSDNVFAALLEKSTPRNIKNLREEISDEFRSYFYDRSTMAAIEPDAKTRGYSYGGTRPGTVEGELLRHLMLFKSFTTSVIQKPLAREIYGRGAMSITEAMKNGNGEMVGLANLMVWNIMFGYLAMSAKDLAKGRTPRDPSSYKTFLASAAQGAGFGIYGDFLFGDLKNRFGGGALSTLAGPTAGVFDSVVDLFQSVRDGDPVAANAFRLMLNNTPFINLFYTRWALDYLILNQISENLSPGYLRRQRRRIKRQNDQTILLPQTAR